MPVQATRRCSSRRRLRRRIECRRRFWCRSASKQGSAVSHLEGRSGRVAMRLTNETAPRGVWLGEWLVRDRPASGLQVLTNVAARFFQRRGSRRAAARDRPGPGHARARFRQKIPATVSLLRRRDCIRQDKGGRAQGCEGRATLWCQSFSLGIGRQAKQLQGLAGDRRCHKIRSQSGRASLHDEL